MITKFKLFETISKDEPEIGDWVVCNESELYSYYDVINFTSNNIGKYIRYDTDFMGPYVIYYEEIPKTLEKYFSHNERNMSLDEIKYISKNKEELEYIIQTNKFNL